MPELSASAASRLTLYVRSGCHLCDEMQHGLAALQSRWGFELRVIDILNQPHLEARYGTRIPVLCAPGQELCYYFLDESAVQQYFDGI